VKQKMSNTMPRRTPGRRIGTPALGLVAVATFLFAAAAHGDPDRSDSTAAADLRLRRDGWTMDSVRLEGADQPGTRHLVASGRIAAPANDIWRVVDRPTKQEEHWPSLKEVVVESASGDTVIARYTMSVPVYPDRRYRLRTTSGAEPMRLDFEMIPGYGNVHQIKGYWKVTPLDDSTSHLLYVLDTDPGVRLVPGFIVSWATRKTVPRLFEFLKEQTLGRGKLSLKTDGQAH
jgi:hypothetical protein